ncbi:MAG: hypothetical protein ACRYFX_07590 [Janthinobacterium lividum]
MKESTKLFLTSLGLLVGQAAYAQLGVSYGATAPRTMLDINGATAVAETSVAVSSNAATIPTTRSQVQLTGTATAAVALIGASSPAPVSGQRVTIYNTTTFPAIFNSQPIPAGKAVEFVYSNGNWRATSAGSAAASTAWDVLGNAGTVDGTNFPGTTDNVALNFQVNNQKVGRVGNADGSTMLGYQSGNSTTTGTNNLFAGYQAGYSNADGNVNTFVGYQAGYVNTDGIGNIHLGYQAGKNGDGNTNILIGDQAGYVTTGSGSTMLGTQAGFSNTSGSNNQFLGA